MGRPALLSAAAALLSIAPACAADRPPEEPRARVEHHLREAEPIARHFESVLAEACPRFATSGEWRAYLEDEIERVVLLVAHIEQAWVEARLTGDDEVRRTAKAPRRQLDRARSLIEKLQACAEDHGAGFAPTSLWRRIERAIPQRQSEIALPR